MSTSKGEPPIGIGEFGRILADQVEHYNNHLPFHSKGGVPDLVFTAVVERLWKKKPATVYHIGLNGLLTAMATIGACYAV